MVQDPAKIVIESVIVIVIVIFGVMILTVFQKTQTHGSPAFDTAQKGKDALSLFLDTPDIELYLAIIGIIVAAVGGGYWYKRRDSGGGV